MSDESKILRENIKSVRMLLKEGVGQGDVIDAINKRKIVTIYYEGEDTQHTGYRTIQPHVLGVSEAGNIVLRAWQEAGDSDSFNGIGRTPRRDHEYFVTKGYKPGWRLFKLDGIKSFTPTGKNFKATTDNQRPLYNPGDKGMANIIAVAFPSDKDVEIKGIGSIDQPDSLTQKISTSAKKLGDKDIEKLATDQKKNIKDVVSDLYRRATRYAKEKTSDKIVVFKNGDFYTDFEKNRNKYQPNELIGNLKDLFVKYSGAQRDRLPSDWHRNTIKKAKDSLVQSLSNKNTEPIK
jgi:hypothetical protein